MGQYSIGIDLGGTNLKGVLMDRKGEIRHLSRQPTEASKGGAQVLQNILELVDQIIGKEGSQSEIIGVGIGTPGFVDGDGMILGGAENLPGWRGTQVYAPIKERFGLSAAASNDVTVAALAEANFGAGRGIANVVMLALGTGVGGGIVINHRIYQGTHGMAGELGHIVVESNGLKCSCGQLGCIESYASGTGIVKNAQIACAQSSDYSATPFVKFVNKNPDQVTAKIVYDYVKQGDYVAVAVNDFVGERLARAVGIILNSLAPDRIILGGGVMNDNLFLLDSVKKHTPRFCWDSIWRRCEIVPAECGENAGVLGAAALAFDQLA